MQRVGVIARQVAALAPAACAANVAKQMAPTGKLRVALNMRNELLITGKTADGQPDGLAPAMAAAFAAKLGVPLECVPYTAPDKIFTDAADDKWDVAMVGADPARAQHVEFTDAYCEIEATCAVPTTSGLRKCEDLDKASVTIAACKGAAYTLWLESNIKNAKLKIVDGHDATYEAFAEEALEALAGLRPKLMKDASKHPGTRLLPGKFMAVQQAACTKKGRPEGFKMLSDFIDEAKASGLVKQLMQKYKVDKDLAIPK
mmetsp:Transcript_6395/g.17195  ORF Transcript_6395/g.17195 Transcript_6395/m.17195 type:complete len:259 (-) Transcript_6395:60-836(-)